MSTWADACRAVEARGGGRCEYCRTHQSLQGATSHVEHVRPRWVGGSSELENLAWCCPSCNLHKSDRVTAVDPETGQVASLFHPRRDSWTDHFRWDGYRLAGVTPAARATVAALHLNGPRRLLIRQAEERFVLFPP